MKHYRDLHKAGKLNRAQSLHLAATRPEEELYDLTKDPFEINNLAAQPKHKNKLKELRAVLNKWIKDSNDLGRKPESEVIYDSDMAVYISGQKRRKKHEYVKVLEANIAIMKKWASEGK